MAEDIWGDAPVTSYLGHLCSPAKVVSVETELPSHDAAIVYALDGRKTKAFVGESAPGYAYALAARIDDPVQVCISRLEMVWRKQGRVPSQPLACWTTEFRVFSPRFGSVYFPQFEQCPGGAPENF